MQLNSSSVAAGVIRRLVDDVDTGKGLAEPVSELGTGLRRNAQQA